LAEVVTVTEARHGAAERSVPETGGSGGAQDQGRRAAPQRPVDYWLKLVDRLINERFDQLLDEHGVTRREWEMLRLLTRGPASLDELDEALLPFLDPTGRLTSGEQIRELVESGWVESDGQSYRLSSRGRRSVERIGAMVERSDEAIRAGVSPEEFETLVEVLRQMARNLEPATSL
jgi:coproporphyrinogen III oxidase-like Fe-S oxidoreductase